MNNEVWKSNFKRTEIKFPNSIATDYCNMLYDLTEHKVIAKVEKYKENIFNMNSAYNIDLMNLDFFNNKRIENNLGEVSKSQKFTYELYLTGTNTKEYKYRFAFIENGVYPYPVTLAIDLDIAKELQSEKIIECKSEDEYKSVLIQILNSNKMTEVIEGLMAINEQ